MKKVILLFILASIILYTLPGCSGFKGLECPEFGKAKFKPAPRYGSKVVRMR